MKKTNLILVLAFSITLFSCGFDKEKKNNKNYSNLIKIEAAPVSKSNSDFELKYSGIIEPSTTTTLNFQLMGTVKQILVEEGDIVKKGQVLATIDATISQNAYNVALATQEQAQDAYNRLKLVHDKGSLPEIKWKEIISKVDQANASAAMSKKSLNNCILKAPSDGVVGSRKIEVGSSVNPVSAAFELVTLNNVYARVSVPENEISKIKIGQKGIVNISAVGAKNYEATVERIGVLANQLSKTYVVKLQISNSDNAIKPGMVCDTKIKIQDNNVGLTIPMASILSQPNNDPYVFVLNESEKKVSKRPIVIGTFTNSKVQVISGLNQGDLIVISGQQKLTDNMLVRF